MSKEPRNALRELEKKKEAYDAAKEEYEAELAKAKDDCADMGLELREAEEKSDNELKKLITRYPYAPVIIPVPTSPTPWRTDRPEPYITFTSDNTV